MRNLQLTEKEISLLSCILYDHLQDIIPSDLEFDLLEKLQGDENE